MMMLATPSHEPVWIDGTRERLHDETDVELAIYAVLAWAFDHRDHRPEYRRAIRGRLPRAPTIAEVVEAILATERHRGPISAERFRREEAGNVMAAFLLVDSDDRRETAAAFGPHRARREGALVQ